MAPHRELKGFDGVTPGRGPALYRVRPLRDALEDTYATDAHLVAYVVEGRASQPRILKRAWERVGAPVSVGVLFADVDTPAHAAWDFEFYDHVMTCFERLPELASAGLYLTMRGARVVQPLDRRVSVGEVEPVIEAWLQTLVAAGLHRPGVAHVDLSCRDWTRHFRAPNVRRRTRGARRGFDYTSPRIDLDRMAPIPPPAPVAASPRPAPKPRPLRPPRAALATSSTAVPPQWSSAVRLLADAVSRVDDGRHALHLALAGALVNRGVALEHLPTIVRAVAQGAGNDPSVDDRVKAARTTVERAAAGDVLQGYGTLRMRWPEIASALDVALEWSLAAAPADAPRTLEDAEGQLADAIRGAPDGVTVIAAECGLGKTHAFLRVARERAMKRPSTLAAGARAPADSKTVLSVDKHSLAIQCFEELREADVPVRRLFSPASLKDERGEPVCRKSEVARALVDGGQAMRWELCEGRGLEPCEHLGRCAATRGFEGDEDARVVIGVHPQLTQLAREAGTTGLLGIDEPPPLPSSATISLEDLDATVRELGSFDATFAAALRPALSALWAWLRYCPSSSPVDLRAALSAQRWAERADDLAWARAGTDARTDDLAELARAATRDEHFRKGPPLKWEAVRLALASPPTARRVGRASRVLNTLHFALTTPGVAKLYAKGEGDEPPAAVVAHAYEPLQRALAREGRTVVLDANAETNRPLYAKALGYEPQHLAFAAPDAAPIPRTLLRCSKATRTGWGVAGDAFHVDGGSFQNALERAVTWALEEPADALAIITMKPIRQLLEDCVRDEDPEVMRRHAGRLRLLRSARARLAPILRRWPGTILWGHYGAVRGLNDMKDADALVTLGDPRPNVTATLNDLALLDLRDDAAERRVDALARAELEQAHGRLRACRRARPARALHVGTLRPGGTGWAGEVEFRELAGGRPKNTAEPHDGEIAAIVEELGGVREAARLAGCHHRTIQRFASGERRPSHAILLTLRSLRGERDPRLVTSGGAESLNYNSVC